MASPGDPIGSGPVAPRSYPPPTVLDVVCECLQLIQEAARHQDRLSSALRPRCEVTGTGQPGDPSNPARETCACPECGDSTSATRSPVPTAQAIGEVMLELLDQGVSEVYQLSSGGVWVREGLEAIG